MLCCLQALFWVLPETSHVGDITVSILCFGKLTCKEVYSWRRFKTATAAGTHRTTEQLAPRSLRDPRRLRGDAAAEESAEPEIVPRQLKAGRSYGKMLLKSGLVKLEGKMAEQSLLRRMAKLHMQRV